MPDANFPLFIIYAIFIFQTRPRIPHYPVQRLRQSESESMGLNIVMGMWQSMKEGKIPFQYSRTLGCRRGPDGRPEIDPDEAETIRYIYRRYLEGGQPR